MAPSWSLVEGTKPYTIKQHRTEIRYLLERKINSTYSDYLTCVSLLSQTEQLAGRKEPTDSVYRSRTSSSGIFGRRRSSSDGIGSADELNYFELSELEKALIQVFHTLRSLSIDLRLYWAWKIMHPAELIVCKECNHQFPAHYFDSDVCRYCSRKRPSKAVDDSLLPYACRTLYNFTSDELSLFLQFLSMQQTLVTLLGDHWEQFDGLAYELEYGSVQQLIKVEVLYWLHHADKQGKKLAQEKDILLKIREVVCDWLGQTPPPPAQEYKLRSKQRSNLTVPIMRRSVSLSMCQTIVLNALLTVLADPNSTAVVHKFFPRGTLLQADDLTRIRDNLEVVESCSQLAAFHFYRQQVGSLHFLGIHESLAEMCPSWKIPFTLTLPRIFHNFGLSNCLQMPAELLLLPLTVLNDTYLYQKQHTAVDWLKSEIEQQIGEAVNDLVRVITYKLYSQCKADAVHMTSKPVALSLYRLDGMINLAGRQLNLFNVIQSEIERLLITDINALFSRMESCTLTFITEFDILLTVIRNTHALLTRYCSLEPFPLLLQRCCRSDASIGNNRLTAWIKPEIMSLLTQGEFDENTQEFTVPDSQMPPPKHPSYCLFGSSATRQSIMSRHIQKGIRAEHFIMLEKIASQCHVQSFPFILHLVSETIDQVFGALRNQVNKCSDSTIGQGDDAASQFYQLQQSLKFSDDTPFDGFIGLFIQLSNAAHLLSLLEKAFNLIQQMGHDDIKQSIRSAVSFLKALKFPVGYDHYTDMVSAVVSEEEGCFDRHHIDTAWMIPLFARMGQMLALDEVFCQKFPLFVDRFIVTLFDKLEHWENENVETVVKAVVHVLKFLLVVTRCESQFLDEGECMKFAAVCTDNAVADDKTVNQHVKNFLGFTISLMDAITRETQWAAFHAVADDIHTEYVLNEDWTYKSEVVLPSFMNLVKAV